MFDAAQMEAPTTHDPSSKTDGSFRLKFSTQVESCSAVSLLPHLGALV